MGLTAFIGTVTGYEVVPNKGSAQRVLMLQIRGVEEGDIQTVEAAIQAGDDYAPTSGARVLVISVARAYRVAIPLSDGITPSAGVGDRVIYAALAGAIKSFVKCLSSGNIQLNGDGDFAVKYNALATQFNELMTAFNTHTHPGVQSGASSTGAATPQSTADITTAKVSTVELPG